MSRRANTALVLAAIAITVGGLAASSRAELEMPVFTSADARLRIVVPRGWRATDQPSYPGMLLWMMRTRPPGEMVLTSEPFTRQLYCTWPITCRSSSDSPAAKYACALRSKLSGQRMRVGPVQAGPKENDAAGLPSVWFEYDDGKKFLRQAVAVGTDRAVSLVLAAPTNDARASHVRPFEQALRTLSALTPEDSEPEPSAAPASPAPVDAGPADGVPAQTPPPTVPPVGRCPA